MRKMIATALGSVGVCLVLGAEPLACAAAARTMTAARPGVDTSLFAAVARVIADSARLPLAIDPRPLLANEVDITGPGVWAAVPASVVEERRRTLKTLGILVGDADIPPNCLSTLSPDETGQEKRGRTPAIWAEIVL